MAVTTGLPAAEAASSKLPRRLDTADELDDDVDRRVGHDRGGVAGKSPSGVGKGRARPLLGQVPDGDARHTQLVAYAQRDRLGLGVDEPGEGDTDVAVAEQPDVHDIGGPLLVRLRLVHVHNLQDGRGSGFAGKQVGDGLPSNDDPVSTPRDEHDRRAQHPVVVGRHGEPVRPGHRCGEHVTDDKVGRKTCIVDYDVTGLAVLAHHAGRQAAEVPAVRAARRPRTRCRREPAAGCRTSRRRPRHSSASPGAA